METQLQAGIRCAWKGLQGLNLIPLVGCSEVLPGSSLCPANGPARQAWNPVPLAPILPWPSTQGLPEGWDSSTALVHEAEVNAACCPLAGLVPMGLLTVGICSLSACS